MMKIPGRRRGTHLDERESDESDASLAVAQRTEGPDAQDPLIPLWMACVTAGLGGLALDMAFPSLGWWPLAFVAISLILVSLIGRKLAESFLVGTVFGASFYFVHVSWAASFLDDAPYSWVPWVALASAEGLLVGLFSLMITFAYRWLPRWRNTMGARLVALPLLVAGSWVAREIALGSWPYGGFPWGRLGMSQSDSPFAPVASWVGVSGLGFLMVVLVATAIEIFRLTGTSQQNADMARVAHRSRSRYWIAVTSPTMVLFLTMTLLPPFPTQPAGAIRVGAVQGNGPVAYMDERERGDILESQMEASRPLEGEGVELVLWPEGSVDSDPIMDGEIAETLTQAVGRYEAPILLNAASQSGGSTYNTSFLWTADGAASTHAKRHPVPFGEYLPDRWLYETIAPGLVSLLRREYAPGTDPPLVNVAGADIGLAICFDVAFDDVISEGAQGGAQVFMFQTNNGDFRGTDENLQQLAFARMRAVETGRSVINLSTTGTSQIFLADGSVIDSLPIDESGLMIADVELRDGLTLAVIVGPTLQAVILWGTPVALLALVVVLSSARRDRTLLRSH